jgi:hypothetical protein
MGEDLFIGSDITRGA